MKDTFLETGRAYVYHSFEEKKDLEARAPRLSSKDALLAAFQMTLLQNEISPSHDQYPVRGKEWIIIPNSNTL